MNHYCDECEYFREIDSTIPLPYGTCDKREHWKDSFVGREGDACEKFEMKKR